MSTRLPNSDISSDLSDLKITTKPTSKSTSKRIEVADSWEDDADEDTETESGKSYSTSPIQLSKRPTADFPSAPPPTPASATGGGFTYDLPYDGAPKSSSGYTGNTGRGRGTMEGIDERRPDKTTSAASRMIAGALGVRAPKRTEEEREYDRVQREKQRRQRELDREDEKRREEEKERAKRAVWDD